MMERAGCSGFILGIFLAFAGVAKSAEPSRDSLEFFETKIRPVLVDRCYSCHSEQSKKLKADLKVDTAAGLLRGGESGSPSVVPGHPEKSKLIEAIDYSNADLQMPPKEKLPAETIENFRAWVTMGAPDPRRGSQPSSQPSHLDITAAKRDWWSFKLPQPQSPPIVKNTLWPKTPIDKFILAKLEAKNLEPSKPADKRTLIRRATYDLIGLPPTPEEIAAFEADSSPDAFEKVVDRLLASPHYGERWGRYWLDVARYADTKGYVFQEDRNYPFAYTFRDWVVRSLNEDLPYDQFITAQIAADQMKLGSDNRPLAAMGFLTVGRRFLNSQPDIIDDRMDVICRGMLAMTVGCARCHDHKFDPIPTKDYYSLYGIFASSAEPAEYPLIGSGQKTAETLAFEAKLTAAKKALIDFRSQRFSEIVADVRKPKSVTQYLLATQLVLQSKDDEKTSVQSAASKYNLRRGVVTRWKMYLAHAGNINDPIWAAWQRLSALPDDQIAAHVQDAANATTNPLISAALLARKPTTFREVCEVYATVLTQHADAKHENDPNAEAVRHILDADNGPLALQVADLDKYLNIQDRNEMVKLTNAINKTVANDPASPARAMVVNDLPQPVQPHVFKRGNAANVGDAVPRAFLAVLSPDPRPEYKDGGRLELAQAIASRNNPLTARVIVNRVWGHHFGHAIVRTPSDFGRRGELPSHPELLDYLALRFENEGWSLKKLHKSIMLSAVYQQASDDNPTASLADPENTLFWKFNRQRLDFEATRDSLLAVSGQLDGAIGGHTVDLIAQPFTHRRTIYGFIDRQNLPNVFRTFDFASPDAHSPQRFFTTVPQQALFMMNSPFVIEAAKAVMKRPEIARENIPQKRIEKLYEAVLDRRPASEEAQMAINFIEGSTSTEVSASAAAKTPLWQYGWGEYDEDLESIKAFHPLTFFTGVAWQGGPVLPAPGLGFAMLTASGGHPGNDQQHDAIRRWTAPRDAVVSIEAILEHNNDQGDGVRARIVSSHDGLLGVWTAKHSKIETKVTNISVKAGDTIDFIVDCQANATYDSFGWSPVIQADAKSVWSAQAQFSNDVTPEPSRAMDAWERYAQVLLETNEFVFVD